MNTEADTLQFPAGPLGELPELVPARMLNEFTYCPRLAYLMWVQNEFSLAWGI